ncbi:uncharacterized protein LOC141656855 isoform X2 [Silene latifolia]|uniref:uncharacterized protein LOC141656855 isoform X2 n=1 Tax=Silene latifolia TaxID=37657 RepID=UPI003D7869AE
MELAAEELGPTKDTVLALLDFLVDPLLPSKCLPKDQLSQEDLVAKQVHAVVLLYNYYHRKQNPGLEFLEFLEFCKLATVLKPTLLSYLSFMQSSDNGEVELELDAVHKDMSLTEKEVVSACDVSRSLDASSDKPNIEGWPISKVAVFLVDSTRENCFLFHSSITMGVWSVIEKDVILVDEEGGSKKKRVIKKTPKENTMEETVLQQAAYLAVKEACVCNQGNLKILESHTVYSASKVKTGVRLYIMRCTKLQQEENLVPISDVLASLQGPLVRKELGTWLLTPVVEYFHLLPFADKLSDWLSRPWENLDHCDASENGHCQGSPLNAEESPSPSNDFGTIKKLDHCDFSHLNDKLPLNTSGSLGVSKDARNRNNHQSKKQVTPNLSQNCEVAEAVRKANGCQLKESTLRSISPLVELAKEEKNGSTSNLKKELPCVSNHSERAKAVEEDNGSQPKDVPSEPVFVYKKRNRSQNSISSDCRGTKKINAFKEFSRDEKKFPFNGSLSSMNVDGPFRDDRADDQKQIIVVPEPGQSLVSEGAIVVAENIDTDLHRHIADPVYTDQDEKQNGAIVSCDSEQLLKMQLTLSSKEDLLSQTARKVLCRKRELLSQWIRIIADEVALCDRNLDIVLKGGGDSLAVKIDAVTECCNDVCKKSSATENKAGLNCEDPDLPPLMKRMLSEANFSSHDPCQELDRLCNDNSWTLPTYIISTLEGYCHYQGN